ncbi:MAG: hypothetical protein KGH57_03685 [Candidatus Micrarchaeota archaeon]|nr:hypothetical protein [Candidatus Micrarchaeota archaeon]
MKLGFAELLFALASVAFVAFATTMSVHAYLAPQNVTSNSTYIYCVGDSGHGSQNLTFYAPITTNGIGQWHNTTPYPVGVDDVGCDIYHNVVYCTGTNATSSENESYYAGLSPNGIGNWIATTPYPFRASYQSCSAYRGYIYCVGDWWYPKQNATEYAPLSGSGIGQWMDSTPYPIPFYWGSCAISNGYIYCVGGAQVLHQVGAEDDDVFSIIGNRSSSLTFFANVSGRGIGKWKQTTPYPEPFTLDGCSIYNSYIYCFGGEGGGNNLTYFAHVSSGGIGQWMRTTDAPIPLVQTGCAIHNGYVYCVGSRDSSSAGHQSWYAKVSGDGVGNWSKTTPFPIPVYGDSYCEIPGSGGGWTGGGGPQD